MEFFTAIVSLFNSLAAPLRCLFAAENSKHLFFVYLFGFHDCENAYRGSVRKSTLFFILFYIYLFVFLAIESEIKSAYQKFWHSNVFFSLEDIY